MKGADWDDDHNAKFAVIAQDVLDSGVQGRTEAEGLFQHVIPQRAERGEDDEARKARRGIIPDGLFGTLLGQPAVGGPAAGARRRLVPYEPLRCYCTRVNAGGASCDTSGRQRCPSAET